MPVSKAPVSKANYIKRKFKQNPNILDGELSLIGQKIRVAFRYSPELVSFIKTIRGSKYESETKTWTVPKEKYLELELSKKFPPDRYPRRFNENDLKKSDQEYTQFIKEAINSYQSDPFSVEDEYLEILNLDVVFRIKSGEPLLNARVKFASKATAILTRSKGCYFIRSEGVFRVSTENLSDLIIKLRDKKISFAFEATSGAVLKKSAELRKKILNKPGSASSSELEEAFLTPYVDFAEDQSDACFILKYASSRHLAAFFPDDDNFHSRKKKSQFLSETNILKLVNRTLSLKYPLYLTRSVHSFLSARGITLDKETSAGSLELSEEMLPFSSIASAWAVFTTGRAGLLIDENLAKNYDLQGLEYESFSGKRFYTKNESELYEFYLGLKEKVTAKITDSFSKLLIDLEERQIAIKLNLETRFKADVVLDINKYSDKNLPSKLFPHQRVAVDWLIKRQYSMLGDDMGLGRTLSVLASFDYFLSSKEIDFALIICPNSLTRNWIRECNKFTPNSKFIILPESKKERASVLNKIKGGYLKIDGLVLNYEKVRLIDVHEDLSEIVSSRKTLLCCDESQRLKNARSKTFQALNTIAPMCVKRICLTGTPTPRDITDIWSQILILDQGKRFGTHYTKWLKSVAELGNQYSDFAIKKFKPEAIKATVSRVHEVLLRRKKEEVVNLPEKTFIERDCKLVGTQAQRYNEIREKLLLRVSTLSGDSFIKQIDNLLEEYLRAVQVASNPRLVDENWQGEPAKYLEIDEILSEVVREQNQKVVIWTNFLGNVRELVKRYEDLGARAFSGEVTTSQRDKTIEEFQNKENIRVLVAVPAAGGVGITLTAAQTAIYLDKSWNAEHWLQSVDRIHRIGQKGSVNIISLMACKIDSLISKNLDRKSKMQAKLLGDTKDNNSHDLVEDSELYPSKEELIDALSEH